MKIKALPILIALGLYSQVYAKKTESPILTGFLPIYKTIPQNYDLNKLTHLIYFSLIPSGDGSFSWTSGRDSLAMYKTFQDLKSKRGQGTTKIILSIGGTDAVGSGGFNTIASDPAVTQLFVKRVKNILDLWGADGVDIDWEKWLRTKEDSDNHEGFLKTLSETLKPAGYTIFTDVPASNWNGQWFNTKSSEYVDYIQPMAYTFSGTWSSKTEHHSSLIQSKGALSYWTGRGVPKEKLVLGVPFYGIGFGSATAPGQDFSGLSSLGGFPEYKDLKTAINSGDYSHSAEGDPKGPYIYSNSKNEIIFYNDSSTLAQKGKMVVDEGYAGAMIWELCQDDAEGTLLNSISNSIFPGGVTPIYNTATNIQGLHITQSNNDFQLLANFDFNLQILNNLGRVIHTSKESRKKELHFSSSKLPRGSYYMRVLFSNNQQIIKSFQK